MLMMTNWRYHGVLPIADKPGQIELLHFVVFWQNGSTDSFCLPSFDAYQALEETRSRCVVQQHAESHFVGWKDTKTSN